MPSTGNKGYKDEKRFVKHMSYNGAIRVPKDYPNFWIAYTDQESGDRYIDPGNGIYSVVFKNCWPKVSFISNEETVGDLMEAMLGLAWIKNHQGQTLSPEAEDFVNMIEQACLSEFSLQTWYPNHARVVN